MPKFASPTVYAGRQSNKNLTGSARSANSVEALNDKIDSLYISPATLASAVATIPLGANIIKINSITSATTTTAGTNSFGSVTLVGGTATISTTSVTANSLIFLTSQELGTVSDPSALAVTARVAGVSFTITASQATDTSSIAWMIVN